MTLKVKTLSLARALPLKTLSRARLVALKRKHSPSAFRSYPNLHNRVRSFLLASCIRDTLVMILYFPRQL